MYRAIPCGLRGLFWLVACLVSLPATSWGAIYRCQDAAGQLFFSNLRCPGAVIVVADHPPLPRSAGLPASTSRVLRARPTRRVPATLPSSSAPGESALPPAWHEWPPDQEELATLPERGQRLCQRKPALCAGLNRQRCGNNGVACDAPQGR